MYNLNFTSLDTGIILISQSLSLFLWDPSDFEAASFYETTWWHQKSTSKAAHCNPHKVLQHRVVTHESRVKIWHVFTYGIYQSTRRSTRSLQHSMVARACQQGPDVDSGNLDVTRPVWVRIDTDSEIRESHKMRHVSSESRSWEWALWLSCPWQF